MTLNLHLPTAEESLKPTITVIGVGGAGGNAVNNMIASNLAGVDFVVANTDAQALDHSLSSNKIQLGGSVTKGLGAGANPQVGEAAAEEVREEIARHIEGSNMVFITAGMGGGTGTGAAPVVAKIARDRGVLTVAVVTKPFQFEGTHRMRLAERGLEELQQHVDTLIIIPNQNLFRIANERTTFAEAFKLADEVLHSGVRGVTDLMVKPGLINLDFADIRAVMQEMGKAMMGTGEASGERRAIEAAEAAISNPLLDDVSLKGAKSLLINITGGMDMTLFEVDEAANRIRQEVDPEANIIFGSAFNEDMAGIMRVSVVATGIDANQQYLEFQESKSPAASQRKPYVFAPHAKAEPVNINPRTAQDLSREATHERHAGFNVPRISPLVSKPVQPAAVVAPVPTAPAKNTDEAAISMAREIMAQEHHTPSEQASRQAVAAPTMSHNQQEYAAPHAEQQLAENNQQPAPEKAIARPIEPVAPAKDHAPHAAKPAAKDMDMHIAPRAAMEPRDIPSTRGLFQRIADASKVLAVRNEEEVKEEKPAQAARTQVKEHRRDKVKSPSLFDDNEEYIDIPAFLRRQVN